MKRTIEALRDPEYLALRDAHMERIEAVCYGRWDGAPPALCGIWGETDVDPLVDPVRCIRQQLEPHVRNREKLRDPCVFHPLIVSAKIYGVHFVDALLGAEVFDLDGTGNWQVRLLEAPVGELQPPDLAAQPAWQAAREAALAFAESGATLPYFDTPCLSSALNVAINLYGQQFLLALYEAPDAVRHDLGVIADLICELHGWYRQHIPEGQLQAVAAGTRTRPRAMGHVCGCSTQLISAEMYREFIVPCEEAVLGLYPDGAMIHLCGAHDHLIPVWREMDCIRIIQVNDRASIDLPRHFAELRDNQVIYSLECGDMPWQEAVRITSGRRLVLTFPSECPELDAYRRAFVHS